VSKHAVFATDQTHFRSRVTRWLDWGKAQDKWERLDDLRRAGSFPDARFFSVRSSDDKQWNGAPFEPWLALTDEEKPTWVKLNRTERAHLLDIGRRAGGLQDAADAMFSELTSDGRWAHLAAVTISDYTWAAARFCFPREAKENW
jgi:hypothetical protein